MNMVVFYLQCIDFVPNLQCPKLMQKVGFQRDPSAYWHNVCDLDTFYLTSEQAKQEWKRPEHFDSHPVSNVALLYGFFHFYASLFQRQSCMVSIKRGKDNILPKTSFNKCTPFFTIEDPFETFDSHCPHDLGVPVQESQCHNILACIEETEEHMRKLLLRHDDPNQDTVEFLWPTEDSTQPRKQGDQRGKTRKTGGNGAGGVNKGNNRVSKGKVSQGEPKPAAKANERKGVHKKPDRGLTGKAKKQSLPHNQGANQEKVVDSHSHQEAGQNPSEQKQDGTQKTGTRKPRKPRNKLSKGGAAPGRNADGGTNNFNKNEGGGRGHKSRQPGGHHDSYAQKAQAAKSSALSKTKNLVSEADRTATLTLQSLTLHKPATS
jgi:Cid1 family poly A polymerase